MIFDLFKNEEVKIELSSEDDYKILSDPIQEDYDIEKVKEKFHYILKEIERAQLEFDELILHITSNFEFLIPKSRGCHSDPTAALGTKRITAGEEMLMLVILGAFLIGSFFCLLFVLVSWQVIRTDISRGVMNQMTNHYKVNLYFSGIRA